MLLWQILVQGWPLLEWKREYRARTPFKLSQSCTNSSGINQGGGGGERELIIWCDIFFQPQWSLYSGRARTKAGGVVTQFPSDGSSQAMFLDLVVEKLGSDLVTFPSYIPLSDPQIRFTLSSKIQIVRSGMPCTTQGGHGNVFFAIHWNKEKKEKYSVKWCVSAHE